MAVYMDGNVLTPSDNLARTISKMLEKENLVIKSLVVNNTEMVNSSLEEILENLTEGTEVVIETASAQEFCMEAVTIALEYIPRLGEGLPKLRDHVLEGNTDQVKLTVDQALEGLEWIIVSTRAAVAQSAKENVYDSLEEELKTVQPVLIQLESALQEEDYTLICDLFEYEISPFLDKMLDINKILIEDQNPVS